MSQTYRRALVCMTLGILLVSGQAIGAEGPAGPTVPAPVSGMPPIALNSPSMWWMCSQALLRNR